MLIVASTPFSNDWRYLDDFWACQFLYAAKLQLDKEKGNYWIKILLLGSGALILSLIRVY
uniref:Uncharacterized protein n=1 Tax=Rhizophagus irregularis (strain DAOM 181602 / DAOM 197198 / MUCL 43194) TaxID=747089 RepID=U9SQ29_RHIID